MSIIQSHIKPKQIKRCIFYIGLLLTLVACQDRNEVKTIDESSMIDQSLINNDNNLGNQEEAAEQIDLFMTQTKSDLGTTEFDHSLRDQLTARDDADLANEPCNDSLSVAVRLNEASPVTMNLGHCESPRLIFNLAQGSKWKLTMRFESHLPTQDEGLISEYLAELDTWGLFDSRHWQNYRELESQEDQLTSAIIELGDDDHQASFEFYAGLSGKHVFQLYQAVNKLWSINDVLRIEATLNCIENCHLQSTLYPIVLVHGYAGVDQYFGILDYFYRVPNRLRERGFLVFIPSLSSIELSSIRANELSVFLDQAQIESGAEKFNIIAHSQGGLDSRYLISSLREGDRIASLTTVATPHEGLPVEILDFFSRQSFSEAELISFNQNNPADPQVSYFSWSARSCTVLEWNCLRDHGGELVTPFLLPTYSLLRAYGANDGLIMTDSMIYGTHLGELSADHFDQIGQIADQRDGAFPHLDFYENEARRLKTSGF